MNELDIEEKKDKYCGKIFRVSNSQFYISCSFCSERIYEINSFCSHLDSHDPCFGSFDKREFKPTFKNEPQNLTDEDLDTVGVECDLEFMQKSIKFEKDERKYVSQKLDATVKRCNWSKSNKKDFKDKSSVKIAVIQVKKWFCIICNEELRTTPRQKQKHIQKHRESLFKCTVKTCREFFKTENELEVHHNEYHSDDLNYPFKCPLCLKLFGLKDKFKIHYKRVHLNEKNFKCDFCDKHFFENADRIIHERTHTQEAFCVCEICGQNFATTSSLRAHKERKHPREKREYTCNTCEKTFSRQDYLKTHMITHSKERKFVCNICSLSFSYSSGLWKHSKLHLDNNSRDFVCKLCGKDFTTKIRITCHMKTHGLPYISDNVYRKSEETKT